MVKNAEAKTPGRAPARPQAPLNETSRERVAARFRTLGEPMRLRILERVSEAPASVGEVLAAVGGTQANVSKHLALLHAEGLVKPDQGGDPCLYVLADPAIRELCALVCAGVERDARRKAEQRRAPDPSPGS